MYSKLSAEPDQHRGDEHSVNPARSTATAVFVGGWAVQQLWLFWIAPVIGAAIAGFVSKAVFDDARE